MFEVGLQLIILRDNVLKKLSCLPIACVAFNEAYIFVRAAGVHRFIRSYHECFIND